MPHVQRTFMRDETLRGRPCPNEKPKPPSAATEKRQIPPQIAAWLTRCTRIQAHMAYIVRLFKQPDIAGGQSLEGETYSERAARFDQTLIHDAFALVRDEATVGVEQIQASMDSAPPTVARPGSREKVAEMEKRAIRGVSIFIDGDAK